MQDASSPDADPDQPGVNNTNPLATVFPAPPPFYKHFIPANQSRLESLQESARQNTESTEEADGDKDGGNKGPELGLDELPHDLRYLIPPKPPLDGKFRSFGEEFDTYHPPNPLHTLNLPQLYPSYPSSTLPVSASAPTHLPSDPDLTNHSKHLIDLTRSLLHTYLRLITSLATDPTKSTEKIEDLSVLLFNAHQIVNEYRPHQAREGLIELLEERVRLRREETERLKGKVDGVWGVLKEMGEEGGGLAAEREPDGDGVGDSDRKEEAWKREEERRIWATLDGVGT